MRSVTVAFAAATALVAAPSVTTPQAGARVVPVTEQANGTTLRMRVGDSVVLTLEANMTTGYAWSFVARGHPVLSVVSARYLPPHSGPGHPILGAGGVFVSRLAVVRTGRCTVALAYLRHTRTATSPARRFRVTIVALPRAR